MNQQHLAIASVPIQEWSTTLEPKDALLVGTVFPELNKPFCCGEKSNLSEQNLTPQENMMLEIQSKGDAITDLTENLAAEQKARTVYDNLLRMIPDPEIREPLKFLRARELVHFQRFGDALHKKMRLLHILIEIHVTNVIL